MTRNCHLARRQLLGRALALGGTLLLPACVEKMDQLNPFADKAPQPLDRVRKRQIDYAGMDAARNADFGAATMGGSSLATTPLLDSYLNTVLLRLVDQLGPSRPPVQAYVLADRTPGAFAYPSGAIFLTHGLLQSLSSEDELAFVLGHELGHVALKHHGSDALKVVSRYALHAAELYWGFRSGGAAAGPLGMPPWLVAGYVGNLVTRDVVSPAWNRDQEDDADRFGVDAMVAAGYNIEACKSVMAILQAAEQKFTRETAVEYTAFEEAMLSQQQNVDNKAQAGDPLSAGLSQAFQDIGRSLSESRQTHRNTEERLGRLDEYIVKFYDDPPAPPFRSASLQAAMRDGQTAETMTRYRETVEAVERVVVRKEPAIAPQQRATGRPQQRPRNAPRDPLTIVDAGPAGNLKGDNYLRRYAALLNYVARRNDAARQHLEAAVAAELPSGDLLALLSQQYRELRRGADAVSLTDRSMALYGEQPLYLREAILARGSAGRLQEAEALSLKCQLGRPEARRLCAEALQQAKGSV